MGLPHSSHSCDLFTSKELKLLVLVFSLVASSVSRYVDDSSESESGVTSVDPVGGLAVSSVISKAVSEFPTGADLPSEGHHVFTQRIEEQKNGTVLSIYTSVFYPNLVFERAGDEDGKGTIIIQNQALDYLDLHVAQQAFIVLLRCQSCSNNKYTAHVAFIRPSLSIPNGAEWVEWDVFDPTTSTLNFLSAFTPSDHDLELSFGPVAEPEFVLKKTSQDTSTEKSTVVEENKLKGRNMVSTPLTTPTTTTPTPSATPPDKAQVAVLLSKILPDLLHNVTKSLEIVGTSTRASTTTPSRGRSMSKPVKQSTTSKPKGRSISSTTKKSIMTARGRALMFNSNKGHSSDNKSTSPQTKPKAVNATGRSMTGGSTHKKTTTTPPPPATAKPTSDKSTTSKQAKPSKDMMEYDNYPQYADRDNKNPEGNEKKSKRQIELNFKDNTAFEDMMMDFDTSIDLPTNTRGADTYIEQEVWPESDLTRRSPPPVPSLENFPTLSSSKEFPYIGIMSCPWEGKSLSKFPEAPPSNIVSFLVHTLRAQCHHQVNESTLRLFREGVVRLEGNSSPSTAVVKLNRTSKLLNQRILNPRERGDFLSAIFLAAYSQAFSKHVMDMKISNRSHAPAHVTPSVRTLSTMLHTIVALSQVEQFERHALKLCGALVSTLEDWVGRLHLESEWLKRHCAHGQRCFRFKRLNKRSTRHIYFLLGVLLEKCRSHYLPPPQAQTQAQATTILGR